MLPLISFETGRRSPTQSSGQPRRLRQQMEVWFSTMRNHGREANTTRRRSETNLHPRSSEARQENFCPLDKDLSWKSANRTCTWLVLHFSGNPAYQGLFSLDTLSFTRILLFYPGTTLSLR